MLSTGQCHGLATYRAWVAISGAATFQQECKGYELPSWYGVTEADSLLPVGWASMKTVDYYFDFKKLY